MTRLLPYFVLTLAACGGRSIPVAVFENHGDGTFGAPVTLGVGGQAFQYPTAVAAADFNGDGLTDIAVTTSGEESTPNPESLTVLLSLCE